MLGLTRQAYAAFKKTYEPPKKENTVRTGGLAGRIGVTYNTPKDSSPKTLKGSENTAAKNMFALLKNFNDRYIV